MNVNQKTLPVKIFQALLVDNFENLFVIVKRYLESFWMFDGK